MTGRFGSAFYPSHKSIPQRERAVTVRPGGSLQSVRERPLVRQVMVRSSPR